MKVSLYVLSFNVPKQLNLLLESINSYDKSLIENTRKILINNTSYSSLLNEYDEICKKWNFEEIRFENIGIMPARKYIAKHFDSSDSNFYLTFEDDMLMNMYGSCSNGFNRYTPKLCEKILKIIKKENYDFLKLNFSEIYLSNDINYPDTLKYGNYHKKEFIKTKFNNMSFEDGLGYIDGEVYFCNWPILFSKEGNKKCFLDNGNKLIFESTISKHIMDLTKKGKIKSAVLLLSPITHIRKHEYDKELRKI
jgi:hypothetical protein